MLKLENITAGYHKNPVIKNINVTFQTGRITAIIGPNGSGKSTLLKAAVSLCEIYQGTVSLNELNKDKIGNSEFAKQVSYLPQSHPGGAITVSRMVLHGRFPHLTYPRHYGRNDYECCSRAMERMGILPLRDKKLDELSGGQRQKVYIAMALAGEMDVYLFDEPGTYLDVRFKLEVLDIIKQLKEQGKTIAVVLHDIDHALLTADQVIIMEQGKVILNGSSKEAVKSGMIDKVFQVETKICRDDNGREHLYFEGKK